MSSRHAAAARPAVQALLLAAVAATGLGQTLVFAILPSLGRAAGMADVQVGFIITCSAFFFAFASPVWGQLSEYVGRKRVLVVGLCGYAVGTALFARVFEAGIEGQLQGGALLALLVVARVAQATIMAASPPAASAYMADITTPQARTRGMARIGAAHNLGTVFGPAMGGMLAILWLVLPLYLVAAFTAVIAALVAWRLPESPYQAPSGKAPFRIGPALASVFVAYRDPRIRDVLLVGIGMFLLFAIVQQTLGFMYQDRFQLAPAPAARAVGFAMMTAALASLLAQALVVQRMNLAPERLLHVGLPLMLVGFVVLLYAPVTAMAAAGIGLTGLGLGLAMPGITSAASLRVGEQEQGSVAGLMAACPALGFIIGPVLGTGLYQWQAEAPYVLVVVLAVPLTAATFRLPLSAPSDHST